MLPKIIKSKQDVGSAPFRFQQAEPGVEAGQIPISSYEGDGDMEGGLDDEHGSHSGGHADVATIISRAQTDARRVVEQAKEKALQIERDAYDLGFQEGQKSGQLMVDQQLQAVLSRFQASLTALDQMRDLMLNQFQLDFLDLVIHTTEKVIKTELRMRQNTLLPMVKDAIGSVKQREGLVLYLNPDDCRYIQSLTEELRQKWVGTQVRVEPSSDLEQGGLRIETKAGEIDRTLETQLELIREQLYLSMQENV